MCTAGVHMCVVDTIEHIRINVVPKTLEYISRSFVAFVCPSPANIRFQPHRTHVCQHLTNRQHIHAELIVTNPARQQLREGGPPNTERKCCAAASFEKPQS